MGRGAFLTSEAEARELATTMVALGNAQGIDTRAPADRHGPAVGAGGGAMPSRSPSRWRCSLAAVPDDVVELTLALAREMLDAAGIDEVDPAQTLRDGTAMDCFRDLVSAQGGDLSQPLPAGAHAETVTASRSGTMGDIDAMAVGLAVWRLGCRAFDSRRSGAVRCRGAHPSQAR